MRGIANSKISALFHQDLPKNYTEWKKRRREAVFIIGNYFLAFSESELLSLLQEWEAELATFDSDLNSDDLMTLVFMLYILYYFKRSYNLLKQYFPAILSAISSSNRDICRSAASFIKYIGHESKENISFLRESLETCKVFLTPQYRTKMIFNSLLILREVGRFLPNEVFSLTLGHQPEVYNATISKDEQLSRLAAKVMHIHIAALPKHSSFTVANSLFIDYTNPLLKPQDATVGAVLALRSIYRLYNAVNKLSTLISKLIGLTSYEYNETTKEAYALLAEIAENSQNEFTENQSSQFFMLILAQVLGNKCVKESFEVLIKFMQILPPSHVPVNSVLEMISYIISNNSKKKFINKAYKVLVEIIKQNPTLQIHQSMFIIICKHSIRALSLDPQYIHPLKERLLGLFGKGITANSTIQEKKVAIRIVSNFKGIVFDGIDTLNELLEQYTYSPNTKIRILMIDALKAIGNKEANQSLVRMATMDSIKNIRLLAIKALTPDAVADNSYSVCQMLADSSYKVRRSAIQTIAIGAEMNCIDIIPTVEVYISDFLALNIQSGQPNRIAKITTLLPQFAKYFVKFIPSLGPNLLKVCLSILLDNQIPDTFGHFKDIRKQCQRDTMETQKKQINPKDANLTRISIAVNKHWFDLRDKNVYDTMTELSPILSDFLPQVIPAIIKGLDLKRSDALVSSALRTLVGLIDENEMRNNIPKLFRNLYPALIKLLGGGCSKEIGILAYKVIGAMGITEVGRDTANSEEVAELIDSRNPQFFTNFVMKGLLELMQHPTPTVLDAITAIFVHDTTNAIPYLGEAVEGFIRSLSTQIDKTNVFTQLEVIAWRVESYFAPYASMLTKTLLKNMDNIGCLRLIIRLSKILSHEYTEEMAKIYPMALSLFNTDANTYFKALLKLIDFGIIYQGQPIEAYLLIVENYFDLKDHVNQVRTSFIFRSISTIVQNTPVIIFSSRLARLCFRLLPGQSLYEIQQLIYNLCVFGDLPVSIVHQLVSASKLKVPYLKELEEAISSKEKSIENLPFIKTISLAIQNDHLNQYIPQISPPPNSVFAKIPHPAYNSSWQWLDGFCANCVARSPIISIRSCIHVLAESGSFRESIFPAAFISCWKEASNQDRKNFSDKIQMILENFESVDPRVIEFIEKIDRAGFPLPISNKVIAKACESTAHQLYLLERDYMKSRDSDTATELLKLDSMMGRVESARGILAGAADQMKTEDAGKWRVSLGEWEKALEYFELHTDVCGSIRCYGHLEMWDQIREHAGLFDTMTPKEQADSALWYAWAFYHSKELEKCVKFVDKVDKNEISAVSFKAIYYIADGKYDEAERWINNGFELLTKECTVFNGSDLSRASRNLVYAQHLVEINEVLDIKRGRRSKVTSLWENRLVNLSHESDAWMKLAEIRSLILSPADHLQSYLKMLSVLRQERKWRLTDAYCQRYFSGKTPIPVLLEQLKIMWDRGHRKRAVNLIRAANQMINAQSEEDLKMMLETVDQNLESIQRKIGISDLGSLQQVKEYIRQNDIDDNMRAKLLRIQAIWQYSLYTSKTSTAESLKSICGLFRRANELRGNDYKTWAWWAQASARALSHFPELREQFAADAITGFLKASQLKPSESLGFLCQMLSIFFRYGMKTVINENLKKELSELNPKIFAQVVPQMVVHIAHVDPDIREVIQKMIINFGESHFEAVVYPLNVLSLIQDKEKAAIAIDVLERIASKHDKLYAEAKLFIDGMHRSAVSWYEMWINGLDTASRANQLGANETVISHIEALYEQSQCAHCHQDQAFLRTYSASLQRCKAWFERYKRGDQMAAKAMWDGFKALFYDLESRMKKIETVQLETISEELVNRRQFRLSVPGTYQVDAPKICINMIDPTLPVLKTQQHPRCVYIQDTAGKTWKFLLKGNEDLRLDQRIIQLFMLINSLLKNNRATASLEVSIVEYSIVPFAPNAGLISWVTGADTFQQLVSDYRQSHEASHPAEGEISQNLVGGIFNQLSATQRFEVFESVAALTPANELREMLWLRSPAATAWLARERCFTVSTALMSMAGYVIGLGDRHPSNIMVQRHTGKVIHIDFGDSFEVAMKRPVFAERVPFRMTRMIVNALDGGNVHGLFRKVCEDVLWVLRQSQSVIVAQLEVFVHEPIFYGKEVRASQPMQRGILQRVSEKLSGVDGTEGGEEERGVQEQVAWLIGVAASPEEYIRHYVGWCPFW